MGILDSLKKDVQDVENKVEEKTQPQSSVAPEVTQAPDRSAYDCPTCGGEGLVTDNFEDGNFVRCPDCQGTGKKTAANAQYQDGTTVIRPEGTFTVKDGQEVKVEG